MVEGRKKRRTILHFGTDRVLLLLRARSLNEMGYHVLNASDGFEAIKLATQEPVDAVVLDLDRNHAEVALVASEIKRCRPQVPTIVLTEGTAPPARVHKLADALVPGRDNLSMLVTTLDDLLATRG
jgi:DNA-binding response OmpR family regulator